MRFSNVRGRDVRQRQCFTSYYPSCLHPPKYYGCCRCAVVSILKVFWKQISPTLFLRIPFWIHLKFKNMFHFVSAMPTFNSCQKRFWGFERRWVTPLSTRCHRLVRYFSDLAKTETLWDRLALWGLSPIKLHWEQAGKLHNSQTTTGIPYLGTFIGH